MAGFFIFWFGSRECLIPFNKGMTEGFHGSVQKFGTNMNQVRTMDMGTVDHPNENPGFS